MQLLGSSCVINSRFNILQFLYFMIKNMQLGCYSDSLFLKARYLFTYLLMMNASYILMPIIPYRSMMLTEFYIYNTLFLTYSFTYPYFYREFLLLIYEIAIFVYFKLSFLFLDYVQSVSVLKRFPAIHRSLQCHYT